jgi:hypothetical protein
MYSVQKCSEKAGRIKIQKLSMKETWPPRRSLDNQFPFAQMNVGEAFFMRYDECSKYDLKLAKERVARYNRQYAVKFAIIEHNDEHGKRREIARIR